MNWSKHRPLLEPTRLLESAESFRPALLAFLKDLISIRSVNGVDGEAKVAARIAEEAAKLRLPAMLVARDSERPNVLVQWGQGPRGFALIGHTDTVSAGDEANWSYPPFGAQIANGKLYGRGTADNKAGLACGLYTLAFLRDEGLLNSHEACLILAGVVDEESGASSKLGVRALLDDDHLSVEGAIYTYASDTVCVGHRGLLRLRLKAHGQAIHSGSEVWSRGEVGVNAVTGLAAILLELEDLHLPAPTHPSFSHLDFTITPGTIFEGGEFESIVPGQAHAVVDVRLLPGQRTEDVIDAVQLIVEKVRRQRPGLGVTVEIKNQLPAAAIEPDHRLALMAAGYAEAVTGRPWPIAAAGPANEGYMLIEAGIPTLCGFGPDGGNAHAADEWVGLDSLVQTVAIYSGIIHDYLKEG